MFYRFLAGITPRADSLPDSTGWQRRGGFWDFSFLGEVPGARLYTWDSLLLLIRGVARFRGELGPFEPDLIAAGIRAAYLDTGNLPTDRLEGGFNLILFDAQAERALIYRNRAASGELFYYDREPGLLLSSNLAELAQTAAEVSRAIEPVPEFLLHGKLQGRETLLRNCHRLRPGELMTWEAGRIRLQQIPSRPATRSTPASRDPEEVLGQVLCDAVALHGRLATLLVGGEPGTRLQAVYNETARTELLPTTFSPVLEVASTWDDTEQVMLASRSLGTEHRLIPVEKCLPEALSAAIATTGEPQLGSAAFFLGLLAPAVERNGFRAALAAVGGPATSEQTDSESWWQWGCRTVSGWFTRTPTPRELRRQETAWLARDFGEAFLREIGSRSCDPMEHMLQEAGQAVTLFNVHGLDLVCPYLDSRYLELVPPGTLDCLPRGLVKTWITPGGPLFSLLDRLVFPELLAELPRAEVRRGSPEFLGRLLAYSLWDQMIFEGGRRIRPAYTPVRRHLAA